MLVNIAAVTGQPLTNHVKQETNMKTLQPALHTSKLYVAKTIISNPQLENVSPSIARSRLQTSNGRPETKPNRGPNK